MILAVNGGSSSVRFAVYDGAALTCLVRGKLDRLRDARASLTIDDLRSGSHEERTLGPDHGRLSPPDALIEALETIDLMDRIDAIGHRIVHGMDHRSALLVSPSLSSELRGYVPIDPDHLPDELAMIEAFRRQDAERPQVACFDTAFHGTMPRVATVLPIPRRYERLGLRRYGFHGLSYSYLIAELGRLAGPAVAHGKVLLAHLGNGASMAALRDGSSVDTSMGFTPSAGLPMGTRTGDLDPGICGYLHRVEGMTFDAFDAMVNHESGLLGISETSADVRELLAVEGTDVRAAEALAVFCYEARKAIGGYAAVLEGLETLVFAGGIGENAAVVRARICDGLGFLGIELDAMRNEAHADIVSSDASRVCVRVIRTDEEVQIARSVVQVLDAAPAQDDGRR